MKRRRFALWLAAISGTTALPAFPQKPGRQYRVGALFGVGEALLPRYRDALVERLATHGFVEGRNLRVEIRSATEVFHEDRELARDLLAAKPDALLTSFSRVTEATQAATRTMPIVFVWVADPVASGIVKTYARPGGNVTGVTNRFYELLAKRLELAREMVPGAKRIAVVGGVDGPLYQTLSAPFRKVASDMRVEIILESFTSHGGWVAAMEAALRAGAEAILPSHIFAFFPVTGNEILKFAHEKRIPVIYADRDTVEAGGLVSYGTNLVDDVRRAADQLARVLKGAKPGELPVDQAARFELAVNLRTAKHLGLEIPRSILARADRVIE